MVELLLDHGQVQPLAGTSYVLIEPPFQRLPLGWEHVIFDVLSKGFAVLLAHPERCAQLAAKPHLCDMLIESGVYFQVNWDSFLGHHGRTARKTAMYLATKDYIHCLATDSHNPQKRHAAHVRLAAAKIEKVIGRENLQCIASENPLRILRNTHPLPMMKPDPKTQVKKESKWWFW